MIKASTISQTSLVAAFMYSILATAGLFYVNLGGAFLSAFVDGLEIGRDEAGFIVSAKLSSHDRHLGKGLFQKYSINYFKDE